MNAGCRVVSVPDSAQGVALPLRLLYPTWEAERAVRVGPYSLDVAEGAPIEGTDLPLVVLSHGGGGTPLVYRDLASHLARAGFVVAMPEHIGNSRSDNSLEGTVANLANRPRHVRVAIDAALADEGVGGALSREGVALIGHSMGGYTALACAGGRPTSFPHESPDGLSRAIDIEADPRINALVLLAPAAGWFALDGALGGVDLPILLWTADKDEMTPALHADIVLRGVRDAARVDHRVVAGGGHFAFQSPFPAAMVSAAFPPSQDPPGFDRAAFQSVLIEGIVAFLRATRRP